jgi:glycosyltransferase involved in cell wall biosynthesis
MNDLVSVVMATYNGEKFLRLQIESILNQSYSNLEVIVVDDGSTDSTLLILQEYANQDSRIKIYPTEKNMGLVANFERGLKLATGEYIALSDQDDVFRKDKIELLVGALVANPERDLVVSDLALIDGEGSVISESMWAYQKLHPVAGKPFERLIYANFLTGCAMMFRRKLLLVALPFPQDCLVHDWWLAVVSSSEKMGGICLVQAPLTYYRQHSFNVIGAHQSRISLIKLLHGVFASEKRRTMLISFNNSNKLKIKRVNGYSRINIWSAGDRLCIERTASLYQSYLEDRYRNLFQRLVRIFPRLRYAILTGNLRQVLEVFYFTFFSIR